MNGQRFLARAGALLAPLCIAGFVLAACSSNSNSASGTTTSTAAGSSGSSGGSTPTTKASPQSGSQFCQDAASFNAQTASLSSGSGTPTNAQYLTAAKEELAVLPNLISEAPTAAVKSDLTTIQTAFAPFLNALVTSGGDVSKVSNDVTTAMQAPAVQTAGNDLDSYLQNSCGIAPSGGSSSGSSGGSSSGGSSSGGSSSGGSASTQAPASTASSTP